MDFPDDFKDWEWYRQAMFVFYDGDINKYRMNRGRCS